MYATRDAATASTVQYSTGTTSYGVLRVVLCSATATTTLCSMKVNALYVCYLCTMPERYSFPGCLEFSAQYSTKSEKKSTWCRVTIQQIAEGVPSLHCKTKNRSLGERHSIPSLSLVKARPIFHFFHLFVGKRLLQLLRDSANQARRGLV